MTRGSYKYHGQNQRTGYHNDNQFFGFVKILRKLS